MHGERAKNCRTHLRWCPVRNGLKGKLSTPPPSVERRHKLAQAGHKRAKEIADGQVRRTLEREHSEAHALVQAAPETEARISAKQAQLEQMQGKHATARAKAAEAGKARKAALTDRKVVSSPEREGKAARFAAEEESQQRRAGELQGHMGRLQREIAGDRDSLTAARRTVEEGTQAERTAGDVYTRAQAEKQRAVPRRPGGAAAWGARLRKGGRDRELRTAGVRSARRQWPAGGAEGDRSRTGGAQGGERGGPGGCGRRRGFAEAARAAEGGEAVRPDARAGGEGRRPRAALIAQTAAETPGFRCSAAGLASSRGIERRDRAVMHDAHDVIAGRKRQLGRERRR